MTPDLQREFQLLCANAKQQLMEVPDSGSYRHVFSIWTLPSFTPSFRWTLYSPLPFAKEKSPFASYTVWRIDRDAQKFESPGERLKHPKELGPTLEHESVPLTTEALQNFLQSLRGISIPLFLEPSHVGCDGTSFKFNYDELFFGCSVHWWENVPLEWRPFTEAVLKIAKDLEGRRN